MTLEEFLQFVDKTISELILYAELYADKSFANYKLTFEWIAYHKEEITGRENIIYEITDKVYKTPDKIFPCVDLIINRPTKEEKLLIIGMIAGYQPREFGRGWSNRPGPFIYGLGQGIKNRKVNADSPEFKKKLVELGLIHY
ncbi:hypothetical protein [Runella sp.]|uniref:hypothetical protein n=1 Tax=Runella sp. TaxID=1960881 RepID=UPI003D0EBB40